MSHPGQCLSAGNCCSSVPNCSAQPPPLTVHLPCCNFIYLCVCIEDSPLLLSTHSQFYVFSALKRVCPCVLILNPPPLLEFRRVTGVSSTGPTVSSRRSRGSIPHQTPPGLCHLLITLARGCRDSRAKDSTPLACPWASTTRYVPPYVCYIVYKIDVMCDLEAER